MLASAETGAGKCLRMSVSRTPLCSIIRKCQGYTHVHTNLILIHVYMKLCILCVSFSNYMYNVYNFANAQRQRLTVIIPSLIAGVCSSSHTLG